MERAPGRAAEIGATALQVFSKPPQRWAEIEISHQAAMEFRRARSDAGIGTAASHDSYLINLATADPKLRERSVRAFRGELERCEKLGLDYLVTHPGHATSGDRETALCQNAELIARTLLAVPGTVTVLIETTAGGGSALGSRFEELAVLIDRLPKDVRGRVGVCLDTAHVFAAGYDLRGDYAGVMAEFDRVVGLERLGLIHCNDSVGALGSRRDRHADIGDGELGEETFAALMRDSRLRRVPRILETPKGDDPVAADLRNLAALRRLARRSAGL